MVPFPKDEYRAAVDSESAVRSLAFLDIDEDVCGLTVRAMTLQDLIALDGIQSPFVCGRRNPSSCDVVVFLWLMSPSFTPGSKATWRFTRKCRRLDYSKAIQSIREYVDETFMDSPSGGRETESFYSFAASFVDLFASEYGWSEADVMACKLKRLFQYTNAIHNRKNPKAILFNPLSGRVRREWLVKCNNN